MSEENMRKQVMEELIDFWINFIYGNPTGSLVTANNNLVNLGHLKRILGISELEKKLSQMQQIMQYWISRFPVKDKKVKAWIEGLYHE